MGCGGFFAKLLNHSMFEILIGLLSANNAEVDLLWQFEDSGAKSFVWCEPSFDKLDFEEVEPIFWFHLLEGANLKVPHCGTVTANGAGQQVDFWLVAGTTVGGGSKMDWVP